MRVFAVDIRLTDRMSRANPHPALSRSTGRGEKQTPLVTCDCRASWSGDGPMIADHCADSVRADMAAGMRKHYRLRGPFRVPGRNARTRRGSTRGQAGNAMESLSVKSQRTSPQSSRPFTLAKRFSRRSRNRTAGCSGWSLAMVFRPSLSIRISTEIFSCSFWRS